LIEVAGLKKSAIEVGQVVFGIAPRLNAVGRLGNADRAVELMTTKDAGEARRIAIVLEEENRRRKTIDSHTLEEAELKIEREVDIANDKAIVLVKRDWHPGVIGIVASRIIEKYYRPVVMITVEEGVGKGSARSIPEFDIHRALRECSDLLLQYGGHKYAAGLTVEEDKIPAFADTFKKVAQKLLRDEDLVRRIELDAEITFDQVTPEVVDYLQLFAPYGPKNNRPLFAARNVEVISPRKVGNNGQHLRFRARQKGLEFDSIGFNLAEKYEQMTDYQVPIDMVFTIEQNEHMNRKITQLNVKDFR
jgi:single-stranded-DNA-specific exonuclease